MRLEEVRDEPPAAHTAVMPLVECHEDGGVLGSGHIIDNMTLHSVDDDGVFSLVRGVQHQDPDCLYHHRQAAAVVLGLRALRV